MVAFYIVALFHLCHEMHSEVDFLFPASRSIWSTKWQLTGSKTLAACIFLWTCNNCGHSSAAKPSQTLKYTRKCFSKKWMTLNGIFKTYVTPPLCSRSRRRRMFKKDKVHSGSLSHLFIISRPLTCYNMSRQSSQGLHVAAEGRGFIYSPSLAGKTKSRGTHKWPRYTGRSRSSPTCVLSPFNYSALN